MNLMKKLIVAAASAVCAVSALSYTNFNLIFSDETDVYTVKFMDFDGNEVKTITVTDGEAIDYSSIDTSNMNKHIGTYTQIRFYQWDKTPETVKEDTTIQALYEKASLSIDSLPERKEYYYKNGNVSLDGLSISITIATQKIVDGECVEEIEEHNITEACTVQPAALEEAFAESDSANISIYPPSTTSDTIRPLTTYTITLIENFGDSNNDGAVDAIDATNVLIHYSEVSLDKEGILTAEQMKAVDIDKNEIVNAIDATRILQYYAQISLDSEINWYTFLDSLNN